MNKFEKTYKDKYLQYHYRPIPVHSLDPCVFQSMDGCDPVLLPAVQQQILFDIQSINDVEGTGTKTRVEDYVMVGNVLLEDTEKNTEQKKAKRTCKIIIVVKLNTANLQDVLQERILNHAAQVLNKRLLIGTQHPMEYRITIRKIELKDYPAVFHPFTNIWLKQPRFLGK